MNNEQQGHAPSSLLPTLMGRLGLSTTHHITQPTALHTRLDTLQKQTSLEMLLQALEDKDESVRAMAVRKLEDWGNEAPRERIIACLHDSSWLVREAAMITLGTLGGSMYTTHLKTDESPHVRETAHLYDQQSKKASFSTHAVSRLLLQSLQNAKEGQTAMREIQNGEIEHDESDEIVFTNLDDERVTSITHLQNNKRKSPVVLRVTEGIVAALVIVGLVGAWFTFTQSTRRSITGSMQHATSTPIPHTTPVTGVLLSNQHVQNPIPAWSADDTHLIAVDSQNGVYDLNIATHIMRKTFTLPFKPSDIGSWEWSFAPDARYLVVASQKGEVQIWDTIDGHMVLRDNTNAGTWPTWEWSTDGTARVVISSYNGSGTAQIWNAKTGEREVTFRSESLKNVRYFSWSPDGQYIALFTTASSPTQPVINGMVQLWNTSTGKQVQQFSDGGDTGTIVWSPDSTRIATASNPLSKNTTVRIWDALAGHKILTYTGHSSVPFSLQWSSNVTAILSTSAHETLVWDVNTGHTTIKIPRPDIDTSLPSSLSDGNFLTVSTQDNGSQVWSAVGTSLPSLSPDGNFLAVSTQDNGLQVWSANSGHLLHTYKNNSDTLNPSVPAVWSPNSAYICFVSSSGKVQMLSTFPGDLLSITRTLPDMIQSLAWSSDNTMLAVSSKTTLQVLQNPG